MGSVAVIGAGHVGCALTFDLISRGYEVSLRSLPGHPGNTTKIKKRGNILECSGLLNGRLPVKIAEGCASVVEKTIIVATPSQGHEAVLAELSQIDLSRSVVIFITGNAVGLYARRVLNARAVLDTATSPYSSRLDAKGGVTIRGVKKRLQIGPLSPALTEAWRSGIAEMFNLPLDWSSTSLEMFFSGVNGVVHVPTALLNMGWIEATNGDFYFYRQGMSSSVCSIIEAADRERLAVAAAYGCTVSSALDCYNRNYGYQEKTFQEFATKTEAHNHSKGAQKRFLSQDVPFWLVLCSDLGACAGTLTPTIDVLIFLASTCTGEDYRMTGRTLDSLGFREASFREVAEAGY
ncbi:hypothetical protein QQS21_000337 [Conoideocrella luteorostrata]|uniref:Opine dehydrogenase domain-containing protein n=1 Tax=Conoideocrella luteorostrata TaxID=1105319 RepID=A0AAJ0D1E2_9HYPO|nr:hypothetical protein QQS21_000337 [Conoideocrella luteorostrata]